MQASILQQDLLQNQESFSSNQVQNSFGAKKQPTDSLFNTNRDNQVKFSEIKEESDSKHPEKVAVKNDLFGVKKDEISQSKIDLSGAKQEKINDFKFDPFKKTLDKEKKA